MTIFLFKLFVVTKDLKMKELLEYDYNKSAQRWIPQVPSHLGLFLMKMERRYPDAAKKLESDIYECFNSSFGMQELTTEELEEVKKEL